MLSMLLFSCAQKSVEKNDTNDSIKQPQKETLVKTINNNAAEILSKKQIPILCYHNIRDFSASSSEMIKTYTVTPKAFAEQMQALSDNGYHTILPEQLNDYLLHDKPLPQNPILITFDDTREEQFTIGGSEMNKYGFKGVYFIMTVSINRPGYMTTEQIKKLSDDGHVIGAHTWDHHKVTAYIDNDWETQLVKPKTKLETITGKPVNYFAYPFGLWNPTAITALKKYGYQSAFILSTKRDSLDPQYTIRRIIVSGLWSKDKMLKAIETSFK
jgi:peptidoglycan/xylan/chitin deacetylase (PgdA/CDA1 family)